MSQYPNPPPIRNTRAIDAIVLPQERPSGFPWWGWALGILGVVAIAVALAVFLSDAANRNRQRPPVAPFQAGNLTPWVHEIAGAKAEDAAIYREIYQSPFPKAPPHPDEAGIHRLLDELVAASQQDNSEEAFREHFDFEDLFLALRSAEATRVAMEREGAGVEEVLRRKLFSPGRAERWRRAIVRPAGEDRAQVFVLWEDATGHMEPLRLWVRRAQGTWKVTNHAFVAVGISEIESWTFILHHSYKLPPISNPPGLLGGWLAPFNLSADAEKLAAAGKWDEARAKMVLAEQCEVSPSDPDMVYSRLAARWLVCGGVPEALRMAEKVSRPDRYPDVYWTRAFCLQRLGYDESALAALEHFERCCGKLPAAALLRTQLLAALERDAEAIADHRLLAELQPEKPERVRGLLHALPPDDQHTVVEVLDADCVASAIAIAENVAPKLTARTIAALREWAAKSQLAGHKLDRLNAALAWREGRLAEAAKLYGEFAKGPDDAEQGDYFAPAYFFWEVHREAGTTLDAYKAAADPVAAFAAAVTLDEYDEGLTPDRKTALALLAAHRERVPRDPYAALVAGWLKLHEKHSAEAAAEFRAGLDELVATTTPPPASDDEIANPIEALRQRLQEQLVTVEVEMGTALEAYRRDPTSENFDALAGRCYGERHRETLKQLLAAHREKEPNDPLLLKYELNLASEARDYARVLELAEQMEKQAGPMPENVYSPHKFSRRQALVSLGRWREMGDEELAKPGTLSWLVRQYRGEHRDDKVAEVLDEWKRRVPNDPVWLGEQLDFLFERGRYAELVSLYDREQTIRAQAHRRQRQLWQEQATLALWRLDKLEDALRVATEVDIEPALRAQLLAQLSQKSTPPGRENARRLLARADVSKSLLNDWMTGQSTPELTTLFFDAERADWRREQVWSTLPLGRGPSLVVFLAEPPPLDVETWKERLARAGATSSTEIPRKLDAPDADCRSFAWNDGKRTMWITVASRPYLAAASLNNLNLDPAAVQALRTHRGWIAVDYVEDGTRGERALQARRWAAEWGGDAVTAIAFPSEDGYGSMVAAVSPALRPALSTETPLRQAFPAARMAYLPMTGVDPLESDDEDKFELAFKTAQKLAEMKSRPPLRVKIMLTRGHASEEVWARVERLEDGRWGQIAFEVALEKPATLFDWPAGTRCKVQTYEILAWDPPQTPQK